jgi:hypothetical protein
MEGQEGVLLWTRHIYKSVINKRGTVGEERKKERTKRSFFTGKFQYQFYMLPLGA